MVQNFSLSRTTTALLVVDVQEKLFPHVERPCEVMEAMQKVIRGFQILDLPIFATEQYPKGLGGTTAALKGCLGPKQEYLTKSTFSCLGDPLVKNALLQSSYNQWVVIGIEAHVCVLQSAKELLRSGMQVTVLNDAISSRSIYDYSTAIAEMRDIGVRVSSVETILFELVHDSSAAEFKQISNLIK